MNSSSKTAPSSPYSSQARSASLKPLGISTGLSPEGKGRPCTPHPSAASMQFASWPQECDNVQEVQRNSPPGLSTPLGKRGAEKVLASSFCLRLILMSCLAPEESLTAMVRVLVYGLPHHIYHDPTSQRTGTFLNVFSLPALERISPV